MMNRIILLFLILSLLIGCDKRSNEQHSRQIRAWANRKARYDSLVIQQLGTRERNDNTVLGFKFGDSKSTIDEKLKRLLRAKKLEIYKDRYHYELSLSPYNVLGKGMASITFELINDRLYKVVLLIIGVGLSEYEKRDFGQTVFKIYKDRYGDNWFELLGPARSPNSKYKRFQYKRIEKNQEISVDSLVPGMVGVEYTDKIAEQRKETYSLEVVKYVQ